MKLVLFGALWHKKSIEIHKFLSDMDLPDYKFYDTELNRHETRNFGIREIPCLRKYDIENNMVGEMLTNDFVLNNWKDNLKTFIGE